MTQVFTSNDIDALDQRYRTNLINTLSGAKSANLVGTTGEHGDNLAIVNSVVHIGAHPPLMGMIMRPHSVRRDTLENIYATESYTLNQVALGWIDKAHQTSARYEQGVSEFDAVGLTAEYLAGHSSPFVAQSEVKIGLKLEDSVSIKANDTILIIGKVVLLQVSDNAVLADGSLDYTRLNTAAITGLDTYHALVQRDKLSYAKPDQTVESITV